MKKYENIILFSQLLCAVVILTVAKAYAVPAVTTSHLYTAEELTDLAKNWLVNELNTSDDPDTEIQITPLDNRIGQKECDTALTFSLPSNSNTRQTTVQISCLSPTSWQLFLPVRVTQWLELLVIQQNITPGTVITADMLSMQRRERRLVRGNFVQDPAVIIGSKNKRSFSVGQIINLNDLCLVCRGDIVTIQINHSGLSVSATGIAQQDGTFGDVVTVKNQQSGRNVQTEVVGVNQVKVKF